MLRPARKPAHLPELLHRQLNTYALAASAAGVGMLALTQPAEARIVYTRVHHVIRLGDTYKPDLANNKKTDFTLSNYVVRYCSASGAFCYIFGQKPAFGNSAVGHSNSEGVEYDSALKAGSQIGPGARFEGRKATFASVDSGFGRYYGGPWRNVSNRYVGLKFKIKGTTHYGWARMNVSATGLKITGTLTGYAYETIPNKPIITGKTKGPDVITVNEGSLGALAAGRK
jgi:hypothetical protein